MNYPAQATRRRQRVKTDSAGWANQQSKESGRKGPAFVRPGRDYGAAAPALGSRLSLTEPKTNDLRLLATAKDVNSGLSKESGPKGA